MGRHDLLAASVFAFALLGCAGPSNSFHPRTRPFSPPDRVTGVPYGSQDREDVTGSVSSVRMDEAQHFTDVVEMLQTQVAGLQVTQLPNGEVRLRIRGTQQSLRTDEAANQPLLVIDGMPVLPSAVGSALRSLTLHQIRSISVLKDVSSTAIYGSRGANGVILIHMKR